MASESLLLVEGESDKSFFEELKKHINLPFEIQIAPPKDVGGDKNTKQGVYNHLPKVLKQLADAKLKYLAVVVDADDTNVNPPDGYENTLKKVTAIINAYDSSYVYESDTLSFKHSDGLADIGLWIMPNNQDKGMLEDLIKTCIHADEQDLLNHAVNTVSTVPNKKFKPHHYSKAEIATWLAWQKKPALGLYCAIEDKLLDKNHNLFQKLEHWLKQCFPKLT